MALFSATNEPIVKVVPVAAPMPKAGGKWNTYEITMRGTRLVVVLNGQKTVDFQDSKLASGPFALQWGRGTIIHGKPVAQGASFDLPEKAFIASAREKGSKYDFRPV